MAILHRLTCRSIDQAVSSKQTGAIAVIPNASDDMLCTFHAPCQKFGHIGDQIQGRVPCNATSGLRPTNRTYSYPVTTDRIWPSQISNLQGISTIVANVCTRPDCCENGWLVSPGRTDPLALNPLAADQWMIICEVRANHGSACI